MIVSSLEENKISKEQLCLRDNDAWLKAPRLCEQFLRSQNCICTQIDIQRDLVDHAKELRDQDQSLSGYKVANKGTSLIDSRMPLNILWLP